jgi:hypothetical protein
VPLRISRLFVPAIVIASLMMLMPASAQQPIQIGFMWHMHQPIYYPYENPIEVDAAGRFSFSVVDVHNQRFGPYTTWPRDAVQTASVLSHAGAQVSFTGSLIENLNALEAGGINGSMWNNWESAYQQAIAMDTSLSNPRLDMVAFGYHHPLMPLLDERDVRMQIQLHKHIYGQTWGSAPYSKGMFPAETAFSTRMIPALVAEGIDWVLVDNIHFDRACQNYPHTNDSSIYSPNRRRSDQPRPGGKRWRVGAASEPLGPQPRQRPLRLPAALRTARRSRNRRDHQDGRRPGRALRRQRGRPRRLRRVPLRPGHGRLPALQHRPDHPMFVVLHHDGDNFGGGSESYYHSQLPEHGQLGLRPTPTTMSPRSRTTSSASRRTSNDVIHVEDGSWAGADAGDPEFKKWLGDPMRHRLEPRPQQLGRAHRRQEPRLHGRRHRPRRQHAEHPDRHGSATEQAWHYLLVSAGQRLLVLGRHRDLGQQRHPRLQPGRRHADQVLAGQPDTRRRRSSSRSASPTIPAGSSGARPSPSDFEVWTYAYDVSGLTSVTLYWRVSTTTVFNPLDSIENETYAGGPRSAPGTTSR